MSIIILRLFRVGVIALVLAGTLFGPDVFAQPAATGSVEGRVLNATSGMYVQNARIRIAGTRVETLTNEEGEYRLANVPPGPVTITAHVTGLEVQTVMVTVQPGAVARKDLELIILDTHTLEGVSAVQLSFESGSDAQPAGLLDFEWQPNKFVVKGCGAPAEYPYIRD